MCREIDLYSEIEKRDYGFLLGAVRSIGCVVNAMGYDPSIDLHHEFVQWTLQLTDHSDNELCAIGTWALGDLGTPPESVRSRAVCRLVFTQFFVHVTVASVDKVSQGFKELGMEAISIDLRRRVAAAVDDGNVAIAVIARRFEVSRRWVYKLIELREETGDIIPRQGKGGPTPKITPRQIEKIKERLQSKPDATLDELRRYCRTSASITSVFRVLQREQITRKKRV